jgi:hemerythrin-like metal-binding protein
MMDDTHEEFITLLGQAVQASDDKLLSRWAQVIDHTQEHFDREDQWMLDTGFASGNCHATQHSVILQVMREGGKRGLLGELDLVRQMAHELGLWFASHVQSMDAALALHLRSAGFDPATGVMRNPPAPDAQALHGCGGGSCGTGERQAEPQTPAVAA